MAISLRRALTIGLVGVVVTVLVLAAGVWLAFIPRGTGPDHEFVISWGSEGREPAQFRDPTGIATTTEEVFVADARNGRIQVFDHQGRLRRIFGRPGDGPGELGRPMNLAIRAGELYVPEYMNDRIQVFGLDSTPRRRIGGPGSGPGEFNSPGGVAVDHDGELFVADFYNHRVQRCAPDGSFITQWGTTGEPGIATGAFTYPTDTALAADGTLYVADGYVEGPGVRYGRRLPAQVGGTLRHEHPRALQRLVRHGDQCRHGSWSSVRGGFLQPPGSGVFGLY